MLFRTGMRQMQDKLNIVRPMPALAKPSPQLDWRTNKNLQQRHVPIQLRMSGDNGDGGVDGQGHRILIDTRVRKGPFWHLSQEAGAWCFTVYNKIYHPRAYIKPEDGGLMKEYEYLTQHCTMWNVNCERQVMVKGPDAEKLVDMVITRKASLCKPGFAKYVILCNQEGGILNDPIMLRPYEDEFWFSLSDSDIAFWLQGVNHDGRYNCEIREIDVSPVQIQGPKSTALMADLVGKEIEDVPYYGLHYAEIGGAKTVISRTGWSTERGYEIYLYDSIRDAEKMWYTILEAGKKHNLKVIAPGHHRRIEAGILSYGQDIDIEVNPFQCGQGWQVDLKKDDFIGKKALAKIKQEGVSHKLAGIKFGGKHITWYISDFYHVKKGDEVVGYMTSAWYSPTQGSNIGFAMIPTGMTNLGNKDLKVVLPPAYGGGEVASEIVPTPFKIPDEAEKGTGMKQTGSKFD
jgi:aminomethyltransferase